MYFERNENPWFVGLKKLSNYLPKQKMERNLTRVLELRLFKNLQCFGMKSLADRDGEIRKSQISCHIQQKTLDKQWNRTRLKFRRKDASSVRLNILINKSDVNNSIRHPHLGIELLNKISPTFFRSPNREQTSRKKFRENRDKLLLSLQKLRL